jgi:dihydrofolate synthase/folylpolyglutamate synthase
VLSAAAGTAAGPAAGTALQRLLARRQPESVHFGLGRIRALLEGLGNPERRFRAIHVAGTNGKGSVAATAESILRGAGRRTGLYTSPHLLEFSERIAIDGRPADAALLDEVAAAVLPLADAVDATFFEATTALAFATFVRAGINAAVVEVGLGGRLDATNVLDAEVAVITSIALDHAGYLGSDPAGIAREKAGVVTEGATVVLGDVHGASRRELLAVAERVGAAVEAFGGAFGADGVRETGEGIEFEFWSKRRPGGGPGRSEGGPGSRAGRRLALRSPLRGAHQAVNVAAAVAAVDAFTDRSPGPWLAPDDVVAHGVAGVRWPGRFQIEQVEQVERMAAGGATRVYDVAHNEAAARVLADLVERSSRRGELPRPVVLLVAVLGDKDWRAVLGPLLRVTDDAVLTDAPSAPATRRWDLHAAAAELSRFSALRVEPDFERALRLARELACEGTVLITGSCYTVGDAMRIGGV